MKKNREARLLAKRIRKDVNQKNAYEYYSIDLNQVADCISEKIGIKIELLSEDLSAMERKIGKKISGYVTTENNEIKIIVDSNDSPNIQRFTIANELGEIALTHKNAKKTEKGNVNISNYHSGYLNEFNDTTLQGVSEFASELLMPTKAIKKLSRNGCTPLIIANEFKVSTPTVNYKMSKIARGF